LTVRLCQHLEQALIKCQALAPMPYSPGRDCADASCAGSIKLRSLDFYSVMTRQELD
jgi:hypothetical protein